MPHPLPRRFAVLLLALPLPLLAQDLPPETSPLPPERPQVGATPEAEGSKPETPEAEASEPETQENAAPEATRPPPRKPDEDVPEQPSLQDDEPEADAEENEAVAPPEADPEAFAACTEALAEMGAVFEKRPRIADAEDGACGIAEPVLLEEAAPGVAMRPDTLLRCETALALAAWLKRVVIPASEVLEERGEVTGVRHGSSYVCRRRNNLPEGKLSEHAFGSAIDVMGLTFAGGSTLVIEPREREGTLEEAFQDAIRAGACLSFTTVLGPGSDAAHADHLHFDIKERKGGFRLCQ
ncbi:extensin family protein [Sulfitobacter aestuarii]|uniref:Extensin family protein n=1 Tax=Sulfitobacter aestuarii TaxID=2161676 RepID=A0ABW5U516_9RHOB